MVAMRHIVSINNLFFILLLTRETEKYCRWLQVLMNVTGCNAFASARFGSHDETITTSTFMIDAAKIHSFLFHSYAICDNCVDSGNKVGENYILCLILKFEEIFPKNRKLSPKDKIISPINRKISPKENFLLIIYPDTDCCR